MTIRKICLAILSSFGSVALSLALELNNARFGMPAVVVDGRIYVVGGWSDEGRRGDLEIITPSLKKVSSIDDAVTPLYWHAAESYKNKIYIFGGQANMGHTERVEVYDTVNKTLESLASWPRPKLRAASVAHDGIIYLIGGENEFQERSTDVDIYDIKRNKWSKGAPMPTARECDVVLRNGKIYAIAGYDGKAATRAFEVYDIKKNAWKKLPDLPFKMSAHHAALIGNQIYTFGDYADLDRVTAYDFGNKRWELVDVAYKPSRHNAVVVCDGKIFVLGGNVSSAPPYLKHIQPYDASTLAKAPRHSYDAAQDEKSVEPSGPSPEFLALLGKITNQQARIQTLILTGQWDANRMNEPSETNGHNAVRFLYNRAGRFLLSNDTIWVGRNDKTITTAFPASQKYIQEEIKEEKKAPPENELSFFSMRFPDLYLLIGDDPKKFSERITSVAQIKILPDEKVNDDICWVLSVESKPDAKTPLPPLTVWIDQQYGLIRRMAATAQTNAVEEAGLAAMLNKMSFSYSLSELVVNQPIDEKEFILNPPTNFVKVDSVRQLYNVQSSDDRFALSGKTAPDFELTLTTGKKLKLSDYKNKVVLLDFWATWCGPCVRSLPHMSELGRGYKNTDVVIIGISRDQKDQIEKVKRFLDKYEITYPVGIDTGDIATSYKVSGIPCLVLIGKDGTIQGRKVGFSENIVKELKESVEKLRAGETLPSGKPMTDEEIAQMEQRAAARRISGTTTQLNTNYFKLRWKSTETVEMRSSGNERIFARVPQRYFTLRTSTNLFVMDMRDGKTIFSAPFLLEDEAMHVDPFYAYLPTTNGGLVISAENLREKIPEKGENHYRLTGSLIQALDNNGQTIWKITGNDRDMVRSVTPIPNPSTPNEWLLLLSSWNSFSLLDARGVKRLEQDIHYTDFVEIADLDQDGKLELYVIGPQTGRYEIQIPAPPN